MNQENLEEILYELDEGLWRTGDLLLDDDVTGAAIELQELSDKIHRLRDNG